MSETKKPMEIVGEDGFGTGTIVFKPASQPSEPLYCTHTTSPRQLRSVCKACIAKDDAVPSLADGAGLRERFIEIAMEVVSDHAYNNEFGECACGYMTTWPDGTWQKHFREILTAALDRMGK